jgi:hypothetical protein
LCRRLTFADIPGFDRADPDSLQRCLPTEPVYRNGSRPPKRSCASGKSATRPTPGICAGVNVEVYAQYDRGKTIFVDSSNKVHEYDAHDSNPLKALPPISMPAKLDLGKAILSMEKMSEAINPEAPWDDIKFRSRSVWVRAPRVKPTR